MLNAQPASVGLSTIAGSVIYLSGAISRDPDWRSKFAGWESEAAKHSPKRILSPTIFPEGWEYDEYMEHCMIMVRRSDIIVMLPCWKNSTGAEAELAYARSLNRLVVLL